MEYIRKLCGNGKIKWTAHVLARLQERAINPSDVKECISRGEVIEEYENDYPHPSCLILGQTLDNRSLHVVIGITRESLWFITAYYPSLDKWNDNLKTRKENK